MERLLNIVTNGDVTLVRSAQKAFEETGSAKIADDVTKKVCMKLDNFVA